MTDVKLTSSIFGSSRTVTIYGASVEELYAKESPILVPYPNILSDLGVNTTVNDGSFTSGDTTVTTTDSDTFKSQDAVIIMDRTNELGEINYVSSHSGTTLTFKYGVKQSYADGAYIYRVPRKILVDLGTSSHNFTVNGFIDADTNASANDDRWALRLMHTNGGTVTFQYGGEYYQTMLNKLSIKEDPIDEPSPTQYKIVMDLVECYKI